MKQEYLIHKMMYISPNYYALKIALAVPSIVVFSHFITVRNS